MRSTTFALVLAASLCARPASAQNAGATRVAVSAGVSSPATLFSEGGGASLRSTVGGYVALGVAHTIGAGPFAVGVFGRGATSGLRARVGGSSYGAGTATTATVGVDASLSITSLVDVRGGVGAAYAHGPSDVVPYRDGGNVHPEGELALTLAAAPLSPWRLEVVGAAYRVGSSEGVQHAGSVSALLLGVRRAF